MQFFKTALRSIIAILAGLMVISLIAELVELGAVSLLNGAVITDQDTYFAIRNQPSFLAAKLVYNSLAAIAGGYVCAWISSSNIYKHGIVLIAIQALSLIWGMTLSPYSNSTPNWVWISLLLLSSLGIFAGLRMFLKKSTNNASKSVGFN